MQPKELSGLSRSNSAPPEVAGAPCKASPTSRSSSPIWTPPPNGDSTISTPSACSSPPARGYPQHSHQLNSYHLRDGQTSRKETDAVSSEPIPPDSRQRRDVPAIL